jgi:hypothetical protein
MKKFIPVFVSLRDRLMVGHGPLKPSIIVRIYVPQLWSERVEIYLTAPYHYLSLNKGDGGVTKKEVSYF